MTNKHKTISYFAYGSNMDSEDLDEWCRKRGCRIVTPISTTPAKLNDYRLRFNYYSTTRDGGAANIMESEKDCVYGLLMELEERDLETIRAKEGYPCYYNEICVDVEKFDGTVVQNTKTYKVVKSKEKPADTPPTRYYLNLILKNAKKYNFPGEYIKYLESIKTKVGAVN